MSIHDEINGLAQLVSDLCQPNNGAFETAKSVSFSHSFVTGRSKLSVTTTRTMFVSPHSAEEDIARVHSYKK